MNKLFEKKALWFVLVNLLIVGVICGIILYTLTYKSVPIQYQHEWFGDDLHKYLIFEHAGMTGIGVILLVLVNISLAIKLK